MSAGPVDTIHIAIEASLNALRADMEEANRIVATQVQKMEKSTSEGGPFAGLSKGLRGLAAAGASLFVVNRALGAIATGLEAGGNATTKFRSIIAELLNVASFGLGNIGIRIRRVVFQEVQEAERELDRLNKKLSAVGATEAVRRRRGDIALELAAVDAVGPQEEASAQLRIRRRQIRLSALEQKGRGADPRQLELVTAEEQLLAGKQATVAAFGAGTAGGEQGALLLRFLEEIAQNTRPTEPE